jgi:hypothetical protein
VLAKRCTERFEFLRKRGDETAEVVVRGLWGHCGYFGGGVWLLVICHFRGRCEVGRVVDWADMVFYAAVMIVECVA